jgi:hypothetical protein
MRQLLPPRRLRINLTGIRCKSKRILAALTDENGRAVETEKLLEIDFAGDRPVKAGDQFCFGEKR